MIDVASFVGPYPFRELPHPDPEILVRVLEREGLSGAWVGHLPAAWQRDPAQSNAALFRLLAPFRMLKAAPVVRPDWPGLEPAMKQLAEQGSAAFRVYPMHLGLASSSERIPEMVELATSLKLPIILTIRFEDLRQRSSLDSTGDLTAAHIRAFARATSGAKIIVTGAGREVIEETHWSLTPDEQERLFWDFAWVWGPPEDHFAHLIRTMGAGRFVYGTHWPLRLTQNSRALLDLLDEKIEIRDP